MADTHDSQGNFGEELIKGLLKGYIASSEKTKDREEKRRVADRAHQDRQDLQKANLDLQRELGMQKFGYTQEQDKLKAEAKITEATVAHERDMVEQPGEKSQRELREWTMKQGQKESRLNLAKEAVQTLKASNISPQVYDSIGGLGEAMAEVQRRRDDGGVAYLVPQVDPSGFGGVWGVTEQLPTGPPPPVEDPDHPEVEQSMESMLQQMGGGQPHAPQAGPAEVGGSAQGGISSLPSALMGALTGRPGQPDIGGGFAVDPGAGDESYNPGAPKIISIKKR